MSAVTLDAIRQVIGGQDPDAIDLAQRIAADHARLGFDAGVAERIVVARGAGVAATIGRLVQVLRAATHERRDAGRRRCPGAPLRGDPTAGTARGGTLNRVQAPTTADTALVWIGRNAGHGAWPQGGYVVVCDCIPNPVGVSTDLLARAAAHSITVAAAAVCRLAGITDPTGPEILAALATAGTPGTLEDLVATTRDILHRNA